MRGKVAGETGLEPATSTVTGWHSNQLSYSPAQCSYYTPFFEKCKLPFQKIFTFSCFPLSTVVQGECAIFFDKKSRADVEFFRFCAIFGICMKCVTAGKEVLI